MWTGFNQTPVFSSPEVRLNSKVCFVGHATTVYSVEQAIEVLDWIGARVDSEDCLPFAVTLVENGELISLSEDNGEFASGELLSESLNGLDGFNALVCVSRKVSGMYPSDLVQAQKLRCIRAAAVKALELLYDHLRPGWKEGSDDPRTGEHEGSAGARAHHGATGDQTATRVVLKPKKVSMEPPCLSFDSSQAKSLRKK